MVKNKTKLRKIMKTIAVANSVIDGLTAANKVPSQFMHIVIREADHRTRCISLTPVSHFRCDRPQVDKRRARRHDRRVFCRGKTAWINLDDYNKGWAIPILKDRPIECSYIAPFSLP